MLPLEGIFISVLLPIASLFFRLFVFLKCGTRMGIMFFLGWISKIDCQCSSSPRKFCKTILFADTVISPGISLFPLQSKGGFVLLFNFFSELMVSVRSIFSSSSLILGSDSTSRVRSALGRIVEDPDVGSSG